MTKAKRTPQDDLRTAVEFLSHAQRKKVLEQIRLLRGEWNGELDEGIRLLTGPQARKIIEFIILMPGEGKGLQPGF
jgi:hypothetical protein